MKKARFLRTAALSLGLLLLLGACSEKAALKGESAAPEGYSLQQLTFPASDAEKTEYNKAIFDIEPFELQVALPEGWSVGDFAAQNSDYLFVGVWARQGIFDENQSCVGAVGYNIVDVDEENKDEPMAIYNQIALGNDYQFAVGSSYNVVKEGDQGKTALVEVYHSPVLSGGNAEEEPTINEGILSYDSAKEVYVAFELDGELPEETIGEIAQSLSFVD